jgi:hypothetical protein
MGEGRSNAQAKLDRRREARQERQRSGRRQRRIRLAAFALVAAAVVALVAVLIVVVTRGSEPVAGRVRIPAEGRDHVATGTDPGYQQLPPASGPHYPVTSRYGVSSDPTPPGFWVHNLEHGAVVLLYTCDEDCETVVAQIDEVFQRLPNGRFGSVKLIATPFEPLESKYMLVAWRWQESFDTFDAARIERFYGDLVDKGPESAP